MQEVILGNLPRRVVVVCDAVAAEGGHGAGIGGLECVIGSCACGIDLVDQWMGACHVAEDSFCHGGAANIPQADKEDIDFVLS